MRQVIMQQRIYTNIPTVNSVITVKYLLSIQERRSAVLGDKVGIVNTRGLTVKDLTEMTKTIL